MDLLLLTALRKLWGNNNKIGGPDSVCHEKGPSISPFYLRCVDHFGASGGYDVLLKRLQSSGQDRPPLLRILMCLPLLLSIAPSRCGPWAHQTPILRWKVTKRESIVWATMQEVSISTALSLLMSMFLASSFLLGLFSKREPCYMVLNRLQRNSLAIQLVPWLPCLRFCVY